MMGSIDNLLNPTIVTPPKPVNINTSPLSNDAAQNDRNSELNTRKLLTYQKIVHDVPSPPHMAVSLDDAIGAASVVALRQLLLEITHNNEAAKNTATEWLLIAMVDDSVHGRLQLDTTHNHETGKSQWHLKPMKGDPTLTRKALEECKKCKAEYRVTENVAGDCIYHHGQKMKDPSSNAFDDCYESWEEPDSDDPDAQHGFPWTCCDQPGDATGCIVTKHEPFVTKMRKRRSMDE